MAPDASGFEELQGRLRGLLIAVADQLPRVTAQLVGEMIDANECGVALETISEMLVKSDAPIGRDVLADVENLAAEMDMSAVTVERLRPLVRRPGVDDIGAT